MEHVIESIPIDLDKPRTLLFEQLAVKAADRELSAFWGREYYCLEALDKLLAFVTTGDLAKLSMANLGILVWQGCRHEDATLTLATVEAAMPHIGDLPRLMTVALAVFNAWQAGLRPLEGTEELVHEGASDDHPLDGSIGAPAGPSLALTSV